MTHTISAPKLLPAPTPIPTSIVCKTCKEETGLTLETIIDMHINTNIHCPVCGIMMFSCIPERPAPYVFYTGASKSSHTYDDYD